MKGDRARTVPVTVKLSAAEAEALDRLCGGRCEPWGSRYRAPLGRSGFLRKLLAAAIEKDPGLPLASSNGAPAIAGTPKRARGRRR